MKRILFGIIIVLLFSAAELAAVPQFTAEEIADRARWEEFLKTADIIEVREVGEGVTKPLRLTLRKGEVVQDACWKCPSGIQGGYLEGWQYEIAAYQIDKLLGLNMVPPFVEREYKSQKGAISLWVDYKIRLLEMLENNVQPPAEAADKLEKHKYIVRAFDALIANEDRNQQNILYTEDWRTLIIDHTRGFRSTEEFTNSLMAGKRALGGKPLLIRKLPRALVEKIRGLSFESIKQAVGPYLTDKEIRAVIIRQELVLAEIDNMIKELGENVFYY